MSRKNPLPPKCVDNKLKGQPSVSGTMRRHGLQSLQRRGRHLRNQQMDFLQVPRVRVSVLLKLLHPMSLPASLWPLHRPSHVFL